MWHKLARWTITLLICAVAIGGGAAWYVWVQGDRYAREAIYRKLAEIAPACRVEIGRVEFDWESQVTIEDLKIGPKSTKAARFLVVPELTIEINREAFRSDQTVAIERICMIRPHLRVTRHADGDWAFKDLMPLHVDPTVPVPAWDIQDATISLRLAQPDAEPIELSLAHADFLLKPIGRRQLSIEGRSHLEDAGPIALAGELDLNAGTWSMAGTVKGLTTAGSVAGFIWNASAAFRDQVRDLEDRLAAARQSFDRQKPRAVVLGAPQPMKSAQADPFSTVSQSQANEAVNHEPAIKSNPIAAAAIDHQSAWAGVLARLGIEATIDAEFEIADPGGNHPLDYELHLTCRDGQISNPLLPFPLSQLRGELDWDRQTLLLRSISARHGPTSLTCDGAYHFGPAEPSGEFRLAIENLLLGENEVAGLPEGIAKCLEIIQPRGPIDVTGKIERGPDGRWRPREVNATITDVSIAAEPFPYPIDGITGAIRQSGPSRWTVDLAGKSGMRGVECHGFFTSRAAGAEIELLITGDPIPIDDAFRKACKPEARKILEMLRLEGLADARVTIKRAPGEGMPTEWGFQAFLTEAGMNYEAFPYGLSNLRGEIIFDSVRDLLILEDFSGQHDQALISGHGTYRKPLDDALSIGPSGEIPGLDLTLSGENVALDNDLREALPVELKQAWDDLRPAGKSDFNARVIWIAGYQPDIELTHIAIREGRLFPRSFPYPLEAIAAKAEFIPWRAVSETSTQTDAAAIIIHEFVGWHAGMRVSADNSRMTLGLDGEWKLHLPQLKAEDLTFDADLREAVPVEMREAIDTLNPRGQFLVDGSMTFRGDGDPTKLPEVSWNLTTATKPKTTASLALGTEVTNVSGEIQTKGHRDGETITLQGAIDLDQAHLLGQSVTDIRGPFTIEGSQVTVGSPRALSRENTELNPVPVERQLRGDLLNGLLTLNANIKLGEIPEFHVYATLTGGSLEKYVAASIGGAGQLAGVMNGNVDFWGAGFSPGNIQGRGRLDIVPASLYRLPAIMRIFQALSFGPPNGPAFSSARLIFTIHDSAFHFQPGEGGSIVLSGDTLKLVGGGRVSFNRTLDLEFYSALPNDPAGPLRNVPLIKNIVGGIVKAATTGLAKVVVNGPADAPYVNVVPLPVLPDTWRAIMGTLGTRVPARPIGFRGR